MSRLFKPVSFHINNNNKLRYISYNNNIVLRNCSLGSGSSSGYCCYSICLLFAHKYQTFNCNRNVCWNLFVQQYKSIHTLNNNNNNNIRMAQSNSSQHQTNKRQDQRQKDQFIHDHLNASQEIGTTGSTGNESFLSEQDIVKEPPRERFGVLKAIIIIVSGIYFGAYVAMIGAKLLEDLDIFVQQSDDDDGD